jgi:hypothetical protein
MEVDIADAEFDPRPIILFNSQWMSIFAIVNRTRRAGFMTHCMATMKYKRCRRGYRKRISTVDIRSHGELHRKRLDRMESGLAAK